MIRINRLAAAFLSSLLILPPAPMVAKTRHGDKLRNDARAEEVRGNYDHALELAEAAVATDPSDPSYVLVLRRIRFEAALAHVKVGRQLRSDGKTAEALAEFQKAFGIDPSSDIAEQEIKRTKEMIERLRTGAEPETVVTPEDRKTLTPSELARKETQERIDSLLPVPELRPLNNDLIDLKMMNKPRILFETVCKVAGVNVLFDPEYNQQQTINQVQVDLTRTTLDQALDQLAVVTKSFWKPLSSNTIFVTVDNQAKRREYAEQVVKVFYLNNISGPQEIQEIVTVLRTVVDIQKVFNSTSQNALVVRCDADTMALVEKLIADLDKPHGECVIDVMVLEVSSTYMRSLSTAFAPTGISTSLVFAPRPGITTPGAQSSSSSSSSGSSTSGGTTTGGTTTTPSTTTAITSIPLSNLGRISSADYSLTTLPGAQFEAVLNDSSTRIIQAPQIRATDNLKASIKIGDKVPTATGSFQPGVAGVGVSPLVNTQFTFIDVGVNVDILPKVHENNEVSLHMELDVSQVKDRIDLGGISQPEIAQNKATADVRLKDGEVNLIGGIVQNSNSRAITGIPGLAGLPVIGHLFNAENVEKDKTELVIAIIPHIVRGPDLTTSNLKSVAAGNSTEIKVNHAPRRAVPGAAEPSGLVTTPSVAGPPATAPPLTAAAPGPPPVTAPPPPVGPALPGGPARISFLPATGVNTQLSQAVTVTLYAENVTDMISAAAHLRFDPKILRITNIAAGDLPQRNGAQLQPTQNILNDTGAADVTVSRGPNDGGISGSGNLFSITLQAVGRGTTSLAVTSVNLTGSTSQAIQSNTPPALVVNVQ
ncbi:MAG TPA: cohesin domain-containing protein [Bryobacteraceae bacterium]|nr:cohesin domain-containing protein [Bryobacteraceae bacterium]